MSKILLTPSLQLLPLKIADLSIFHQINIQPFVRQYLWDDEEIALSLAEEILMTNQAQMKNEKTGLWKILHKDSGSIIGYTGLWYFFEESQPQLLYALLPEFTGKNYAYEAATAILTYAFQVCGFQYIDAACDAPNIASQKLAVKLSMNLIEEKEINGKMTLIYRKETPI